MSLLSNISSILLLVFGFGFVIFFHELGHFLAAKWVGIRVEQFAVGFGQAVLAWRKGLGLRFGTTTPEMEDRIKSGTNADQFGETEYRLNWIPLGGYVKMLGQDDMKPGADSDDPRAFNRKSVGARVVVVSAGVIMNIILAAIGFTVVFTCGMSAPAPLVGGIRPGSPAQQTVRIVNDKTEPAPLQVGDRILYLDDKYQHDFTKIALTTALAEEGTRLPMYVERVNGTREHLWITPHRSNEDANGFLALGLEAGYELRGADAVDFEAMPKYDPTVSNPDLYLIHPDDTITEINGQPVKVNEFYKLDAALQSAAGKSIQLTVRDAKNATRTVEVRPHLSRGFDKDVVQFAGLQMRTIVRSIPRTDSPAIGKLLPGDVILSVAGADANADVSLNPTISEFVKQVNKAGTNKSPIDIRVLRHGKEVEVKGLIPSLKVGPDQYGLGIEPSYDQDNLVVGGVLEESPAARAKIPAGAVLVGINGQSLNNWFDVNRLLSTATPDVPIKIEAMIDGKPQSFAIDTLSKDQIASMASNRLTHGLALKTYSELRKASNPLMAAAWGATETRDFVLQFYLTLKRMFQGSVSPKNMMGPVGIFTAGKTFADKGMVWLIWFLSMISANLAVVNFLPIPIVDGGLFTFLMIEKLQGKPISARMQSIAQVAGLALILGIFLLVTYQDIMRLPFLR